MKCLWCENEITDLPMLLSGVGVFCTNLCREQYQVSRLDTGALQSLDVDTEPSHALNDVEVDGFGPGPLPPKKDGNPKDRAASNRLDLTLFPDSATCYGALAMAEGDFKYGGYNFRNVGVKSSVYVAACRRHLAKWFNGEECDPLTKVPHLANAIACIAVLIDSIEHGNLNDDRPPVQDTSGLLVRFEDNVKHLRETFEKPGSPERKRAAK